jgi:GNAT superfamily N-acetyltransferase
MPYRIEPAIPEDVPAILALIKELAVFEKEPEAVVVSEALLLEHGFGPQPLFTCLVAKEGVQLVGMSFCYIRYSTWKGPRLYLEDLIVTGAARGQGIGSALFDATIQLAKDLRCTAICWQVLDWNEPAQAFYEKKGAKYNPGWMDMYLELNN